MPLLDIATAQPSFQNCVFALRAHNKIVFGNEKRVVFGWRLFQVPKKGKNFDVGSIKTRWSVLVIRAVATLEPQCLVESNGGQESHSNLHMDVDSRSTSGTRYQSSSEDSEELDEKEKLRRMRISIANKGNTPWNKGRKHSAETLQRIRERTRVAMLDPKVKMKLVKMGQAQSKETRKKIGDAVRIVWQRRREKLMLQETCYYEWQNSIAEASRRGFVGDEELQWDSYKIMDEQLEQEWLESVEQRKKMTRPKGSKRAPKSFEQRRKISEAISAKWADPAYHDRVCSALAKYHGKPVGAERKPRRSPSGERQPRKLTPAKKKAKDTDNCARNVIKSQRHYTRLRRNNRLLYKDPLASSKLEMIKNIRAQRAAAETKKAEAIIEQAKLLIAEAEKAAKALEAAAIRSPLARASLIETRKLIAEAIQSIQSIEIGQVDSPENGGHPSIVKAEPLNHAEKESNPGIQGLIQTGHGKINGTHAMKSSKSDNEDFGFGIFNLQGLLNGKDEVLPTSSRDYGLLNGEEELYQTVACIYDLPPSELCSIIKQSGFTELPTQLEPNESHEKVLRSNGADFQSRKEETPRNSITGTRKWVCGSLLEAVEGE